MGGAGASGLKVSGTAPAKPYWVTPALVSKTTTCALVSVLVTALELVPAARTTEETLRGAARCDRPRARVASGVAAGGRRAACPSMI